MRFVRSGRIHDELKGKARQSLKRLGPNFEPYALRKFALIGARFLDLEDGTGIDTGRFIRFFNYLHQAGLPLHPDFEVDIVNIEYGRDYLLEDPKLFSPDVTIVSNVPMEIALHPNAMPTNVHARGYPFKDVAQQVAVRVEKGEISGLEVTALSMNMAMSPLGTAKNWEEKLTESDSKFLLSVCLGHEVNLDEVCPANMARLGVITPSRYGPYASSSDIPELSLDHCQITGQRDYVERMGMYMTFANTLGRTMYAISEHKALSTFHEPDSPGDKPKNG